MWYRRLPKFLVKIGFKESYSEPSLFIYLNEKGLVYLFTYVDSIVVMGSAKKLAQEVIGKLMAEFVLRELGDLNFFLGIHVNKTEKGI